MTISKRMSIIILVQIIGLLVICGFSAYKLKSSMLLDRKIAIKNVVEIGVDLLTKYYALEVAGTLTRSEAQRQAVEALRVVKYGQDGYYFIFDTNHVYKLYPTKPEYEGTDKSTLRDSSGVYLIKELVDVAKAGGGFVNYKFPRTTGPYIEEPKISYSVLFNHWDWVIGSGVYIDDVEHDYRLQVMQLGIFSLVILLISCTLGVWLIKKVLHDVGAEPDVARTLSSKAAEGYLTVPKGEVEDSFLHSLSRVAGDLQSLVLLIEKDAVDLTNESYELKAQVNELYEAGGNCELRFQGILNSTDNICATAKTLNDALSKFQQKL